MAAHRNLQASSVFPPIPNKEPVSAGAGSLHSPMQFSLESFAALATIVGTILGLLAIIQARNWLIVVSLPLVGLAIVAGFYARRERLAVKAATITIEGRSIDSLNVANLRRRVNRTLTIQEAHHTARIEGEDLKIEWVYSGYCRAKQESAMEFSVESEQQVSFDRLDCFAYDLGHDPAMAHKIRPLLIGADGVSKKLSVPFLAPLRAKQAFRLMLKCTFPRATKVGFGYYSSTLSFAQNTVPRCTVRLIFSDSEPVWVRVYESSLPQKPTLVKILMPVRQKPGEFEYLDVVQDVAGRSARVYAFWRDAI